MVFKENFSRLTVTAHFHKNEYFKNVNFFYPFFWSMNYNNVVVTKQVYFSPTFSKS